jgi:hypothetical protein
VPDLLEGLLQKGVPQPVAGIGEQGRDGPAFDGRVEPIDAVGGGEIGDHRFDRGARRTQLGRCLFERRVIGGDQQVVAVRDAELGKLEADSAGGSGDDGKRTSLNGHVRPPCVVSRARDVGQTTAESSARRVPVARASPPPGRAPHARSSQ